MPPKLSPRPRFSLLDAFAGPHGIDGYLEQVNPLLARRTCRATVLGIERQTSDSATLTLEPNRAWRGFRAGQFVQVAVEIDGVRHQRCYSLASAEGRRPLEITVKRHPEGLVSNYIVDRASEGMVLELSPADGEFLLPRPRPRSLLLIGGGSGLTPLASMIRTLLAEGYDGTVALLHYAPHPEDAIYGRELARLAQEHPGFKLLRSYTQAPGLGEIDGYFDPSHLPYEHPGMAEAETFACGPPSLLEAVRKGFADREELLHTESFLPPTFAPIGEPGEGTVCFTDSGVEVANSGTSLLEQAEAAGLRPEYGCRMGICHTCTCRKGHGTHKNLVTGEVSSAPDEEIQPCVSAALGDIALAL